MTIDPSSPVPKYLQLREILIEGVERGDPAIGAPIPSERELCRRHRISRMTVRQAVDQLVAEGRLHRVPGKGTFVARPKIDMPLPLTSFTEDMRARGMRPGARVLDRRVIAAGADLAGRLGVVAGAPVHFLHRLRTADGEPMAVERSHIPLAAVPGLPDEPIAEHSLYELLERRLGIVMDAGEQTIEAGIAGAADAAALGIPPASAVLLLRRRSYAAGRCVELALSTYRADRYQLYAALSRDRPGRAGDAAAPRGPSPHS